MSSIVDRDRLITNSSILLRMASELGMPYFVTEQYPSGLGRTIEEVASAMTDPSRRVEKSRFSAAIDLITDQFVAWRRSCVIICGIEAHVCVLQTALGFAGDKQVFVVADAVESRQPESRNLALRRMERAGIELVTADSVAALPAFRGQRELVDKLRAYYVNEVNTGVLTPGARERAMLLQGTRPGTPWGEAMNMNSQRPSSSAVCASSSRPRLSKRSSTRSKQAKRKPKLPRPKPKTRPLKQLRMRTIPSRPTRPEEDLNHATTTTFFSSS